MDGEVEVEQRMSEETFTSCLQIYERLGRPAPAGCAQRGGCRATRLIAGAAGIVMKGPKVSCSIGDKAAACGSCCASSPAHAGHCPFG
jgi:hypothetical protein